jgi:hypothetical protein
MNAIALQNNDLTEFQKLIDGYYAGWSFSKGDATAGEAFKFYATDPDCIFYDTQPPVEGFQGAPGFSMDNISDRDCIDHKNRNSTPVSRTTDEHFGARRQ